MNHQFLDAGDSGGIGCWTLSVPSHSFYDTCWCDAHRVRGTQTWYKTIRGTSAIQGWNLSLANSGYHNQSC